MTKIARGRLVALSMVATLTAVTWYAVSRVPDAPTYAPQDSPERQKRRVFCENHKPDDPARAYSFKASLKNYRCDSVESALSPTPCAWTVTCAPGYTYGFIFDKDGEFLSAVRLR